MTVVDRTPSGVESVQLRHNTLPQRLLLLDTMVLALLHETGEGMFGVLREGEIVDIQSFPNDTIGSVDPYLRIATADAGGDYWAVAYVLGDRFYVFRGLDLVCIGTLREGSAFTPDQRARGDEKESVAGTVIGDTSVWMLAIDSRNRDVRLLDEYSLTGCEHLRSYPLPVRARTLTHYDGIFFVEHEPDGSEIIGLRLSGR